MYSMRQPIALILVLIGMLFIKAALWLDVETLRGVTLEVIEKLSKLPTRKPDPSGLYPRGYEDVERYTIEDFEEHD